MAKIRYDRLGPGSKGIAMSATLTDEASSLAPPTYHGVVRNGVVVMDPGTVFPDGTEVVLMVKRMEFTPEEAAEFAAWDRLSAEAMKCIEDLERQERDEGR
jgi:hypothetical protein